MATNLYIVSIPSRNGERTEAETKDKALSNVINRIISKEKGIDFNNKGYSNRGIALAKAKELYNAGVIKITEVKSEPITITIPEPKLNPQMDLFKESYSMKDAGAFDIPNSTGLLIPPSQTAPLADFKYFERYDPNQKGHRPNLSQPSKLKNIVPTRENPPFGKQDDYQKLNPNMIFDLGTDEFNIRRDRIRGFIKVLSEIKNKIALDITPDLEEQLGTDKIWVIYDDKVVVSATPYTSHTALFRRLGLSTSGKAFDRVTRGVYFIKDNILHLEWYGDTGKEEEFENGINRLIDEIDKAGYKDRYSSIKMNTLQKYGKQAPILDYSTKGFTKVLSEIKNKIAEENIHGIIVTIPKSELNNLKKEDEFLQENEGTQFWNLKKTPSNLNIGDRIYFVEDGYITCYQIIEDMVKDMHCDVTDRDWVGTNLILSKEVYNLPNKIPYKGFQGFRYINDELKNKLRQASILDYPKPGLCPSIWDENGRMLTIVKDQIINKLLKFFKSQDIDLMDKDIVSKIMIIGSLTSYQYAKNSDLDCHIHFSIDKILDAFNLPVEELVELIDDKWRKELNAQSELVKNTQHPLEFYFEMEGYNSVAEPTDGVYDLFADKWVKEPRTVDIDFDINEKYPEIIEYASNLAKEIDGEIGSIHRDIKDIQLLQETIQSFPKDKQKLFLDKLQNKIDEVEIDIQDIVEKGLKVIKDRHIKYNPYSKENITFKYLQRYLYFDLIKSIKNVLVDEKTDKIEVNTIEDVSNVEEIIDEF